MMKRADYVRAEERAYGVMLFALVVMLLAFVHLAMENLNCFAAEVEATLAAVGVEPKPFAEANERPAAEVLSTPVRVIPQALYEGDTPEDYENLYIEQALIAQRYYRDDVPLPYEMQDYMQSACDTYGVPYALALAVCQQESGFDPLAQNGPCMGYMQINSCNHETLREKTGYDPTTPHGNIVGGVAMLGDLLDRYGNTEMALCCYNAGEAGAQKHYFSNGITSTTYSRSVLAYMEAWEAILEKT